MEQTGPKYTQFRKLEYLPENTFELHASLTLYVAVVMILKR